MNAFYDEAQCDLGSEGEICGPFLNKKVELRPPKPKKYLVKINIRGLNEGRNYLNYDTKDDFVLLNNGINGGVLKTNFTKSELKSIRLVREFLEDMEGKYELIEVEE